MMPRVKWNHIRRNLKIGDIVLMIDENEPRNVWRLARISKLLTSTDDLVRKVEVFTGGKYYDRPVTKLIFLLSVDEEFEDLD